MLNLNIGNLASGAEIEKKSIYDVAIIGAGPAGLTAGMYTSRSLLSTVILEKMGSGGQAAITDHIENYPGFSDGINGFDLAQKMEEQAKKFGTVFEYAEVEKVAKDSNGIFHIDGGGSSFLAKTVIAAPGASPKRLGVPGEDAFIGNGISFCATCDGAFYKEKTVAVIGGGDSAMDEGIFLTKFAKKVIIIHRRNELRAEGILQKRAMENPKIEFIWNTVLEEVIGEKRIQSLKLKNVVDGTFSNLIIDGLFLFIGLSPNTGFIDGLKLDEWGYIITDSEMATNIDGLFAAGDSNRKSFRQIITAASDGAIAAHSVKKYLENK